MIGIVVDFCFSTLSQIWSFLSNIQIIPGVSLLNFALAFIVISVVIFGLISTVKIVSGRSVGVRARHVREREYAERRRK